MDKERHGFVDAKFMGFLVVMGKSRKFPIVGRASAIHYQHYKGTSEEDIFLIALGCQIHLQMLWMDLLPNWP
jgi:hypothetical protein